jgi:hypothetical protein
VFSVLCDLPRQECLTPETQTGTILQLSDKAHSKWSHIIQLLEDEGLNAEFSKIIQIAAEDIRYDVEESINLGLQRSKRLRSFQMVMANTGTPILAGMKAIAEKVRAEIIH